MQQTHKINVVCGPGLFQVAGHLFVRFCVGVFGHKSEIPRLIEIKYSERNGKAFPRSSWLLLRLYFFDKKYLGHNGESNS